MKHTLLKEKGNTYNYAYYNPKGERVSTWDERRTSYDYVLSQVTKKMGPEDTLVEKDHTVPFPKTITVPKAKPKVEPSE